MSDVVVIEADESPSQGDDTAPTAVSERAEEVAIDATVAAAVAATEAAHEAADAEEAASVADAAASVSASAADAALSAAAIAEESAGIAGRTLDEVYAIAESIPERVALAVQGLLNPEEPETIDEVITEELREEVAPRGQHWWFRNKMWGR